MSVFVSVVVTTYNGESFIEDQLESIYQQDQTPDEVLIYDDCSTDNTVEIIERFIEKNSIRGWKLFKNTENCGWKVNFMNGLSHSKGDIVFPCDQDDIWGLDKISSMVRIMNDNPKILLLCSNYQVFYSGASISTRVKENKNNNSTIRRIDFSPHFLEVKRPGCSYAVRKDLVNKALHIWQKEIAHDACLWRMALLYDGLYIYNSITMQYRRHNNNLTGKNNIKNTNAETILSQIENMIIALNLIKSYSNSVCLADGKMRHINNLGEYLAARQRYLINRNVILVIANYLKYYKYYPSLKTVLWDLYLVIIGKV